MRLVYPPTTDIADDEAFAYARKDGCIMLQESTKSLLIRIVQLLETAEVVDWDDQGQSGRECLYEMHQMTRPTFQAYKMERTDAKWPLHLPDSAKLNRALPHVKAMVSAIRHQDRSAALFSGKAALAEM